MKLYQLRSRQLLPTEMETAWQFLSDPRNLQKITPDTMGFSILSGADRPIYSGLIIHYKVAPFPGLSISWVTEITHVEHGRYFVDEQRFGPYALWHHKHFLSPADNGVWMEDVVDYKMPYGVLGQWLHGWLVKKRLDQIFRYRSLKLEAIFGAPERPEGFPVTISSL